MEGSGLEVSGAESLGLECNNREKVRQLQAFCWWMDKEVCTCGCGCEVYELAVFWEHLGKNYQMCVRRR